MPGKCPHCGAEAKIAAIRAANGRCPSCGAPVKVRFTGVPRPVRRPSAVVRSNLRQSLENIGPYEVLDEISRGGMGIVYKARDKNLKKAVAIKILLRGEEASSEELARFRREAEAAAKLQHSNIVPIHAVGVCEGLHYFVMDFIEGQPLSEIIARGSITPRQSLEYVEQLADALAYAHAAGVIHRDVKPANVMIDRFGRPQIMDFGLAKDVSSETQLTQAGTTMGTPTYMPPEQAEGKLSDIDAQSDVYSLGAVLYELLTGRAPFEGPTTMAILMKVLEEEPARPRRLNPRIHPDIENICLKAMAKEKRDRYASAAEFRDDIRRFKAGEVIAAASGGGWRTVTRAVRRRAETFAVLLLVFLALGGWGAWRVWRDQQERLDRERGERQAVERASAEAEDLLAGREPGSADLDRAAELYSKIGSRRFGEEVSRLGLERVARVRRGLQIRFYLDKGRGYLASRNYEAARDMFQAARELDPGNQPAREGLRLAEGTGSLTVSSRPPGAAVYISETRDKGELKDKDFAEPESGEAAALGRKLGLTPLAKVDVPMGLHRITLVKAGCGWQSLPLLVERNEAKAVEDVDLFEASLADGDLRAVANVVRVPAGKVELEPGREPIEVEEFLLDRYEYPNRLGAMPRRDLSWAEARELAESGAGKARKRLPGRAEWMLAAGGPAGLEFPYGNAFDPLKAVTGRTFDEGPLPAGSRPEDRAVCGAYDLSGNLSEWVAEEAEGGLGKACGGNWNTSSEFWASTRAVVAYESGEKPPMVGLRRAMDLAGRKPSSSAPPAAPPAAEKEPPEVYVDKCPPDMVEVAPEPGTPAWKLVKYPFCIERYEWPSAKEGDVPKGDISAEDAEKEARKKGRRLPTWEEWQVACGGPQLWKYPAGDEYELESLPVGFEAKDGPRPSGSKPRARSPFGAFDMNGNLAEWVRRTVEGRAVWSAAGGCWVEGPGNATSSSCHNEAGFKAPTVGFRCVVLLRKKK